MTLQAFKENDALETRVRDVALPTLELLGNERDLFYEGAYTAFPLGGVLYDLMRSPLAGVIFRENFIISFFAIHASFVRPGVFEFYLEIFRTIWGEDVEVEFTVPNPGVLLINISALSIQLFDFAARRIVSNAYVYDEIIDEDGDTIVFQVSVGIRTQSEVDALINEISPQGVYIEATLTLE